MKGTAAPIPRSLPFALPRKREARASPSHDPTGRGAPAPLPHSPCPLPPLASPLPSRIDDERDRGAHTAVPFMQKEGFSMESVLVRKTDKTAVACATAVCFHASLLSAPGAHSARRRSSGSSIVDILAHALGAEALRPSPYLLGFPMAASRRGRNAPAFTATGVAPDSDRIS